MASTLDPLTGLPVIGGTDFVSQIPLGTQVVPWGDIDPSTLPQQGPAYPNDIINTFGWVTGEQVDNPGVVRAGTMTADRRLRVDTGSSGAASPVVQQLSQWQLTSSFASRGTFEVAHHNALPTMTTLFGVDISVWPQAASIISTTNDWQFYFIANGTRFPQFILAQGIVTTDASGNPADPGVYNVHKEYPVGVQLSTWLVAPPGQWDLFAVINIDRCTFDIELSYV